MAKPAKSPSQRRAEAANQRKIAAWRRKAAERAAGYPVGNQDPAKRGLGRLINGRGDDGR